MVTYLKGDATYPIGEGYKIICHVCNDIGKWGSGFVMAISKRWAGPEREYRRWFRDQKDMRFPHPCLFKLGEIQTVVVEGDITGGIYVANMIAQHGIWSDQTGNPPIRYDALRECLKKLANQARVLESSVHMPRIGCGLAGGVWEEVSSIVEKELDSITVYVYDIDRRSK